MDSFLLKYLKYIPPEEHTDYLNAVAHDTVNSLNKAIECDSSAMNSIFGMRVVCHKALGASDILVVDNGTVGQIGVLGILNGILCKGTVTISPVYDSSGRLMIFVPAYKTQEHSMDEDLD